MSEKNPPINPPQVSAKIIDWNAIHRRLDGLRDAIAEEWRPGEARVREILAARAQRLAQPVNAENTAAEFEILQFKLGRQRYGIDTSYVREVFSLNDFTAVPCTPAFVIGVTNIRGEIISLIDIRRFFGIEIGDITDLNKVIVVSDGAMVFGIVVDNIEDVSIAVDTLLASTAIAGIDSRYLRGITSAHVAVLDILMLLREKTLVVDEGG